MEMSKKIKLWAGVKGVSLYGFPYPILAGIIVIAVYELYLVGACLLGMGVACMLVIGVTLGRNKEI
jgi:hypothetical protein